ncbi:MAG: MmcQ/YjbR family DNA-binding protein [Clostridia bacterium]|nr:MmcQ/YjbR family DNA-binding protein [Clostridia bacterium]
MEEIILKNKKINYSKLIKYGFIKNDNKYFFSTPILNDQFILSIEICDSQMKTKIIESATLDEYILHLTDATGEFVGKIRSEYKKVLQNISNECFENNIFTNKQTIEIITYITKVYGDELEYLWEKFPNNAIWRRKDSNKWYGALLKVSKRKLKIDSDEIVEIIDLRANEEEIAHLIDNKTIFAGYHMNKKHWVSICLDNIIPTNTIFKLIDNSYNLAKK